MNSHLFRFSFFSQKKIKKDFTITAENLHLQSRKKRDSLKDVRNPAVAGCSTGKAQVAKLVDALVSGARAARCGGSNPFLGTQEEAARLPLVILKTAQSLQ